MSAFGYGAIWLAIIVVILAFHFYHKAKLKAIKRRNLANLNKFVEAAYRDGRIRRVHIPPERKELP